MIISEITMVTVFPIVWTPTGLNLRMEQVMQKVMVK